MTLRSRLELAVHDKVYYLTLNVDEEDGYGAQAFATANKELSRLRKYLDMCLVEEVSASQALAKISKCQDSEKVADTALGCFSKVLTLKSLEVTFSGEGSLFMALTISIKCALMYVFNKCV